MTSPIRPKRAPISARPRPAAPRQMNMAFESAILLDLSTSERAGVVAQLASLLLQATGRAAGDDDGEL